MASRLSCKQRALSDGWLDPIRHLYQRPVYHNLCLTKHTASVCLSQGFVSLCTTSMRIGIEKLGGRKAMLLNRYKKNYEHVNNILPVPAK